MSAKHMVVGVGLAAVGRALLVRGLVARFGKDVRALNGGEYAGLLSAYADDAVLRFNVGDHRWSGNWSGRSEIERFLQNFAAAGMQGEIKSLAISGPPWAMAIWARFDDYADSPTGERLYENRATIVLRTRWGKIVDHEDFWVDTSPIAALDRKLEAAGIAAVPRESGRAR